jgi:putative membrane-bound dehydrogenase-like protein
MLARPATLVASFRFHFVIAALTWSSVATWATSTSAGETTIAGRTIKTPDDFTVELAAGPTLVERPIAVARDERGRLYVTDSAGMTDRADKQLEAKPHRIRRLEDRDGDGVYDHSTLYADRFMFPEGCMWHEGSLYVAAPPQIWKLTDADDDGVAEQREVWFDGLTLGGCANDLHGPYLGRDGWFYWCKGAFAEQKYTLPNGKPFVTRSSHIFRARPDATQIEPVLTGGMDNPVNVAFLSTGERILSCTFFQFSEAGRRDGLIHAIYGGVYGKRHDSIYAHKMTGDVMPNLVHEGAAAPCGLIAGSSSLFGGGHGDHLFACYFNLHKVVHYTTQREGATLGTKPVDLISSDHPDFHPTDVFEDADGSLLVVDTGGWYKVCCPTSQLAKPDVLGAVYRLRRKGQPKVDDPLGSKIAWNTLSPVELAGLLGDSRQFVVQRATKQLRRVGEPAVAALRDLIAKHTAAGVRQQAVWTLAGIESAASHDAVQVALGDRAPEVVQAACHVTALRRDRGALPQLVELLSHQDAAVARVAAEAIGRGGDATAIPALFKAVEQLGTFTPDASGAPDQPSHRIREHALIYALIEIGESMATQAALTSTSPQVRRAGLVALDQMDASPLNSDQVVPLLNDREPILSRTAAWIVSHRPTWGPALVDYFTQRLQQPPSDKDAQQALAVQLAQLAKSEAIQSLLAMSLTASQNAIARQIVLRGMIEARPAITPLPWLDALAATLSADDANVLKTAAEAARTLKQPKGGHAALNQALVALGKRASVAIETRLNALTAVGGIGAVEPELFTELTRRTLPEEAYELRSAATDVLAKATLTDEQRATLVQTIKQVGALELPKLLPAFEKSPTETLGLQLIAALQSSTGFRGLRVDLLKQLLAKYPATVQQAGATLVVQLNAAAAEQSAHLDRLLKELPPGDVRRGHEVFLSKKAACATCHAVGYLGGRLGPDLTNIGKVRNERDLVESIVYPSASFVRSYEPVTVVTDDGVAASGIITSETSDELVVTANATQSFRFKRSSIIEIQPAPVSVMPQGFVTQLSLQEIADLVAFMKGR